MMSPYSLQALLDPITSEWPLEPNDYEIIGNASFEDGSVEKVVQKYIKPYFLNFSRESKQYVITSLIAAKNKEFEFIEEFDQDDIFLPDIVENAEDFLDILYKAISNYDNSNAG